MQEQGFTVLDNNIFYDENINIYEQSIFIAIIKNFNRDKGYSFPSYKQLKVASKISDNRTLIKNIKSLIDKGYLKKETKSGIGCKYYPLKYINIPSGGLHQEKNSTTCKIPLPSSGELHHDLVENSTTTNTNTNTNTNKYNAHMQYEQLAEKLWKLYPCKKGKARAIKKIPKLIQKYGFEQIKNVIDRYRKYVESTRENGFKELKYQNGSTFFNGTYEDYLDKNYKEDSLESTVEMFDFGD